MKRTWTIIGVRDVPTSFRWYQSLFGQPATAPGHPDWGQFLDTDGTVLLCLHQWGVEGHPSLTSPHDGTPGNGLLLFFRVDDFGKTLTRARALVPRLEEEPRRNPNTKTDEFSLRDPDGYFVTVSALAREQTKTAAPRPRATKSARKSRSGKVGKPTLLAGGNPRIAKGYGDAPVKAYLAALPDWKRDVGRRVDALVARTVPGVRKAVKWNSPFYGVEGRGWFLGIHVFKNHVKLAFFSGASLRPLPPGRSKQKAVRYLDIHEKDQIDEARLAAWVEQAVELPGWATADIL